MLVVDGGGCGVSWLEWVTGMYMWLEKGREEREERDCARTPRSHDSMKRSPIATLKRTPSSVMPPGGTFSSSAGPMGLGSRGRSSWLTRPRPTTRSKTRSTTGCSEVS